MVYNVSNSRIFRLMQNILDFSDIDCLPKREIIAEIEWDLGIPLYYYILSFLSDYIHNSCFWAFQLRLLILCFLKKYSNGVYVISKGYILLNGCQFFYYLLILRILF